MDNIDVFFLYQYYNFPIRKVGSSFRSNVCPACGESSRKSHKVILNERYWFCFRCGEHGNGFEFIKKLENVDFKEALEIWNRIIGNEHETKKIIEFKKIYKEKSVQEKKEELELKQELIKIVLKVSSIKENYQETNGWKYLTKIRNISDKILHKYINNKFFIVDYKKIIKNQKIISLCEKLDLNYKMFTKREIVFPFWENEKIIGAEFRTVEVNTEYPKTISLGKKKSQLWNDGKFKNILLCEGFIDALSARSLNWDGHILVVPGVSHAEEGARILKNKKYKKIYSAFDPDEAGIIAVQRIKEIIKKVTSLKLPEKKDLNDIVSEIDNIFELIPENFWDKVKKKLKIA